MVKPTMTVFAGTNGAGKSTLTSVMAERVGKIIDPDAIAKNIHPENPAKAARAAGVETLKSVQGSINQKRSFSIETTLSGSNVIRQMRQAKEAGFEVELYYIGLNNVNLHINRVRTRVAEGGHFIPEEDIRRRYERSFNNLPKAIGLADRTYVFDNSREFTHVLTLEDGRIELEISKLPKWTERLVKELIDLKIDVNGRSALADKLKEIKHLVDAQKENRSKLPDRKKDRKIDKSERH